MSMDQANALIDGLARVRALMPSVEALDGQDFRRFSAEWHAMTEAMKDAVFQANPKNSQPDRRKFEYASGAQSIQFMADLLPFLHDKMVRHYDRSDELGVLDVGAGSAAGTHLLAQLHSDNLIWSRLRVEAVDHVPWRQRWVAMHYPHVNYQVLASAALPSRHWDFVVCSHVIEHLDDPTQMINDVLRACRGFAFLYAPYNEVELSPGHLSVITEETFLRHGACEIHMIDSMGFHGSGRRCILAVFDRREAV
ncbi:class I SAM-dependent methyltransferase [Thermomonas sp.]|uniref:class I SAM-dependent methyltransferase n=1 Tax=Thermomonas sp. TaxID=1971895 RepID=UPI00248789FC|nr:class I SAM-dependent methyltransferase [Thermomonas sp.]MDI1253035.1 class I SAM-dependent methyltransferase [Thermomonas sp.]